MLLAELDGGPVGYALYHPTWSTEVGERGLYLYDLYVRAERPRTRRRAGVDGGLGGAGQGRGSDLSVVVLQGVEPARRRHSTVTWAPSRRTARSHALLGDAFEALAQAAPPGRGLIHRRRVTHAAAGLAGLRGRAAAPPRQHSVDPGRRTSVGRTGTPAPPGSPPAELCQLLGGLDALGADGDAEAAAELHDGAARSLRVAACPPGSSMYDGRS